MSGENYQTEEISEIIKQAQSKKKQKMKVSGSDVINYIASKYIPDYKGNSEVEEHFLVIKNSGSKFVLDSSVFKSQDTLRKLFSEIEKEYYSFLDMSHDKKYLLEKTKAELAMFNIIKGLSYKIKDNENELSGFMSNVASKLLERQIKLSR